MLNLSGSQITGSVRGKLIMGRLGTTRPNTVALGTYALSAPVTDPVFGVVVTAIPVKDEAVSYMAYTISNTYISSYLRQPVVGSFVITDHPIPGMSCLVMSLGFAELTAALKDSGGDRFTVA